MVIIIVPYPCGTIFSILLIIMGVLTLPIDPGGGFSMIIFGTILLVINQALSGSRRSMGSPIGLRGATHTNRSFSKGRAYNLIYYCPRCNMEFNVSNTSNLCPNCQVPLKTKTGDYSNAEKPRRSFYFENR
ncbi:MAG: hypothetical protein ACW98F_18000 [Candidatus Hodarchaeales archaeon]|jgi:hypothetical protein